jgi:mevalonate kinase
MPAFRLDSKAGYSFGTVKLGPMLLLPAGTRVELCGAGFNSRTVKVRHRDSYYFVFQENLAKSTGSITVKQRVAERATWQENLLNEYAQAVRFYQSIVLQLKEAGDAGDFSAFEELLRKAQDAREALSACKRSLSSCPPVRP